MLTIDRATDTQQVIEKAMAFPMDAVLERYMDEHDLPAEVAREHERELKRFLVLCALDPDAAYGMNGPVDELWHTFIMFTLDYARFCEEVAGRFLHHVPASEEAKLDPEAGASYERMLAAYADTFDEEPPTEFWPSPGSADVAGSQCNIICIGTNGS